MAAKTGLPAALIQRINRAIDSYSGTAERAIANAHSADDYFVIAGTDGRKYHVRVVMDMQDGGFAAANPHLKLSPKLVVKFYWVDKNANVDPFKHYTGYSYDLSTLVKALGKRGGGLMLDMTTSESIDRATLTQICVWAVGGDPYSTYG
jgi:hypothetical protein